MKKRINYCWLILFSCCMLQGAGFGVVSNCSGLFYKPVSEALGISIGTISVYSSISIVVSCFVMMIATRLLERFNTNLVLTIGAICTSLPMLLMSFCNAIWQWYVLAIFQGIGLAFTMNLVAPIILNNWFHKKLGFALGLSVSSGGIFGVIMSSIIGAILETGAWRKAYFVSGTIGLIISVPVCMFVLCMRPEDKGMQPYGGSKPKQEKAQQNGVGESILHLLRDIRLWKILPLIVIARVNTGFLQHITTYGSSIGMTIANPAVLTSLFMVGNMLTKLSFGSLNDRWGAKRCSYLGLSVILAGLLLLLSTQDVCLLVGAFLFGAVSMFSQVQIPLICRNSWDGEGYARAMVVVNICSQISYSLGISGIGFAYDFLGAYQKVLVALVATVLLGMAFVHIAFRKKERIV